MFNNDTECSGNHYEVKVEISTLPPLPLHPVMEASNFLDIMQTSWPAFQLDFSTEENDTEILEYPSNSWDAMNNHCGQPLTAYQDYEHLMNAGTECRTNHQR